MNNQIELTFVQYHPDSYVSACLNIIHQGARRILLRPFNSFATEFLNRFSRHNAQVTFYVKKDECELPLPKNAKLFNSDELTDAVIFFIPEAKDLSSRLLDYLDLTYGFIIAPITQCYYKNKPLFLISIPKSGTHLLYRLTEIFGYKSGIILNDPPSPGKWYCLEYSNSHTSAKDFFIDSVRRGPFGNRHHPFPISPAIFIYRNPLDILVSEANYYHKDGKTVFHGYFSNRSFEERLLTLIDDPWLLGSIRDRIGNFIPWLEFQNVIPISFEELVGAAGGGSEKAQAMLIWSLQLKLHIPGNPKCFGEKLFNKNSPTFHEGRIGSFKKYFTENAYEKFNDLPQNFMAQLGYDFNDMDNSPVLPKRADEFRKRPLLVSEVDFSNTPITIECDFLGHNIVRYRDKFYIIPQLLGPIDLTDKKNPLLKRLKTVKSLDAAKQQIMLTRKSFSLIALWESCKRKLMRFLF